MLSANATTPQALEASGFAAELWGEARSAAGALAARRGSALLLGTAEADQLPLTGGLVAQILGNVSATVHAFEHSGKCPAKACSAYVQRHQLVDGNSAVLGRFACMLIRIHYRNCCAAGGWGGGPAAGRAAVPGARGLAGCRRGDCPQRAPRAPGHGPAHEGLLHVCNMVVLLNAAHCPAARDPVKRG